MERGPVRYTWVDWGRKKVRGAVDILYVQLSKQNNGIEELTK